MNRVVATVFALALLLAAGSAQAGLSGFYYGSYGGGDVGRCVLIIARDGTYLGGTYSFNDGSGDLVGSIDVEDDGSVRFVTGKTMGGATFSGGINAQGSLTGTWRSGALSGTFAMNPQSSGAGSMQRYCGTYIGTFAGADSGKGLMFVDSSGSVKGLGYSSATYRGFSISGSVAGSGAYSLTTRDYAGNLTSTTTGTIGADGSMSGTWSGPGGNGTYSGSLADSPSIGAVSGSTLATPILSISDQQAISTYKLPDSFASLAPVSQFRLAVTLGATQEASYWVRGVSGTPSAMALYKLKPDGSFLTFHYGAKGSQTDGDWWFETDSGAYVNPGDSLSATAVYYVHSIIKDNGAYDAEASQGIIQDPQVLGSARDETPTQPSQPSPATPSSSTAASTSPSGGSDAGSGGGSGSGGGCVLEHEGSWSLDMILLLGLALVGAVRRRPGFRAR